MSFICIWGIARWSVLRKTNRKKRRKEKDPMAAITKGVKRGACWMTSQTCKVTGRGSNWRLTGKLAGKSRMLEEYWKLLRMVEQPFDHHSETAGLQTKALRTKLHTKFP